MTYGVTVTGFVRKPIETILEELSDDQKAEFGAGFDTSSTSPAGQLNGAFATQLDEIWEVMGAIYSAIDPDAATGSALSALSAWSGTTRTAATKSTVTATVNLNAGVTLAIGAVASVSGDPTARFVTTEAVTNSGGAPADVAVEMEAETAGVVIANTGTLTVIETPQTGWNSITNAADATQGSEAETDAELRVRREEELRRSGAAAVDAIRADILAVTGVTSCTVFQNASNQTDAFGVPPKAIECVVKDGDVDDIAQAIWDSIAAGIESFGSVGYGTTGTAVDDKGQNQVVPFSRPQEVPIHISMVLVTDDNYPANGDDQVKQALVDYFDENFQTGDYVIYYQLLAEVFSISGVTDVTSFLTGIADPPAGTSNITLTQRQLATLDTANIDIA